MMRRLTAHRLHQWAGLGAGLWLAVLGLTGFVLDHRDWVWLWQSGIPPAWVPERIVRKAEAGQVLFYRFLGGSRRITGGRSGLWWSEDAGRHWAPVRVSHGDRVPPVYQMLRHGGEWLLATADGLWALGDNGREAHRRQFSGYAVTALAPRDGGRLWVVVDRSELWSLSMESGQSEQMTLPAITIAELPPGVTLSRWVHDLHFGRGVFAAPWSLLWSDAAGLGMMILPLTGFLYWWLPRRFRGRRRAGQPASAVLQRHTIRWLYRLHGPLVGLLVVLPMSYLAVTGILLDHGAGLRSWMKSIQLPRAILPPVYELSGWQGEIRAVLGWPQAPDRVSLGTRLGLFILEDGRMRREALPDDRAVFIWMARQDAGIPALGGMGVHMPSDVVRDEQGRLLWMSRGSLFQRTGAGYEAVSAAMPELEFVPWHDLIEGLHTGLLLHPQWKWANDLFAMLALLLAVTGLWRWWRVKWL